MRGAPHPGDGGDLLYAAPTPGYRRMILLLLAVVAALTLLIAGLSVLLVVILAQISGALAVVTGLVVGVLLLVLLALMVINLVLQSSMTFAVTTRGIALAPPYRRVRSIPWQRIAAIEASQSMLMKGATIVVLQDGTRLTGSLTNASARFAHPPAPPHLGPDADAPVPLRAARDGLDRFRRGEFAGSSPEGRRRDS